LGLQEKKKRENGGWNPGSKKQDSHGKNDERNSYLDSEKKKGGKRREKEL